jgi:hypothetical protein
MRRMKKMMNEIKPNQKINYYPYSFELETTPASVLPKLPYIIATERTVIDNYTSVIGLHEDGKKDE